MSESNEQSDKTLNRLYKRRKQQHAAPASIKRALLTHQQQTNVSYIFKRLSYVAVAASTLLLFSMLIIHNKSLDQRDIELQTVHVHSLTSSNTSQSAQISHKYAEHYQSYLAKKQRYAQHHRRQAILTFTDDTWQLETCNNEVFELSKELITALTDIQKIDASLTSGDSVEIAFDQTGIILGIQQSGNYLQC